MDYLNIDYKEAWEIIPFDLFDFALKESIVDGLMKTEEGQQYLKDCKRLKEKNLDMSGFKALKEKMSS